MMPLADRISLAIRRSGLPGWEIAERIGIGKNTLSRWLNGHPVGKTDKLADLARLAGVDPGWLMNGIGDPDSQGHAFLKIGAAMLRTPEIPESGQGEAAFGKGLRLMLAGSGVGTTHAAAEIPLVGVAAGSAVSAMHLTGAIAGWVECPPSLNQIPALYALQVVNNSMWPDYPHGRIVFVDPHAPVAANDIVIVQQQLGSLQKVECFIKQYVDRDAAGLHLIQRAGNTATTIANAFVKAVHKVVGAA